MGAIERLVLPIFVSLAFAACAAMPDPTLNTPRTMPDGRVVQPPPGGWPSYDRGGESGGSGGGRN